MVVICEFEGCDKAANYGTKENKFMRCATHKLDTMKIYKYKVCETMGCIKQAFHGTTTKLRCTSHKLPDDKDLQHRICEECNKLAVFCDKISNKWYCSIHKKGEAKTTLKLKKCKHDGCNNRALYGFETQYAERCKEHKEKDMVNKARKLCLIKDCKNPAIYTTSKGKSKPTHCSDHADKSKMFNINNNYCELNNCNNTANYGDKIHKLCSEHKLDYPRINKNICVVEGCNLSPCYRLSTNKSPTHCATHADKDNMVNSASKCDTCGKHAYFKGDKYACLEHKTPDMKIKGRRLCDTENCKEYASYGRLFNTPTKCRTHAPKNYLHKEKLFPKCDITNCKEKPFYCIIDESYPTHCEQHKHENMINIIEKPCRQCGLEFLLPNNCDTCVICRDAQQFIKVRENRIKAFLDTNLIKYESHDKIVDTECNKYRPDFVIDYGTFYVILEVDEDQHKRYQRECEITRMKNLHQTMGMDTLFIRFNPDIYTDQAKHKIKSYTNREKKLKDLLDSLKNLNKLDHYLMVIYLFYDGFDGKITMQKIEY
nr:Hypothetical protein FSTVLC9_298 [Faustovirus]